MIRKMNTGMSGDESCSDGVVKMGSKIGVIDERASPRNSSSSAISADGDVMMTGVPEHSPRIGLDYQAEISELLSKRGRRAYRASKSELSVCRWKVCEGKLTEKLVSKYVELGKYYRFTEEEALEVLNANEHQIEFAVQDLEDYAPGSQNKDRWSKDELAELAYTLKHIGKDFNDIKKLYPGKSMGSILQQYYKLRGGPKEKF